MANLISLLRVLLAFGVVGLLYIHTHTIYLSAFVLTIVVIWMDGLDGYVARKLNESSKMGAVIDILGDRVVEMTYWIAFLALGWVSVWIPLLVMARGIVVDGFRAIALEQGYTAFGSSTMMQSKVGVFLVSSRASRWLYAAFKAIAFSLMILAFMPGLPESIQPTIYQIAMISVYITVFFCIVRGLPVLVESKRFFQAP
jgi:CDP-diacylglycerol---glycerol-3-phosphate 3-phosphatidyltransferase